MHPLSLILRLGLILALTCGFPQGDYQGPPSLHTRPWPPQEGYQGPPSAHTRPWPQAGGYQGPPSSHTRPWPQQGGYMGPPSSHTRPWQQTWNTLPMPLPRRGVFGSMEPQNDQVPRYGSLGDDLSQGQNIEVLPQQGSQGTPVIQSAVPEFSSWATAPQQFMATSQDAQITNMMAPQQSVIPEMTSATQPHIPDMTAPSRWALQPWSKSYTPLGSSGQCFNQCRNRCPSAPRVPSPCSRPPVCSSRCNIQPRCPSRRPSWNQGQTKVCGTTNWGTRGGQGQWYQGQGYGMGQNMGQNMGYSIGQNMGQSMGHIMGQSMGYRNGQSLGYRNGLKGQAVGQYGHGRVGLGEQPILYGMGPTGIKEQEKPDSAMSDVEDEEMLEDGSGMGGEE